MTTTQPDLWSLIENAINQSYDASSDDWKAAAIDALLKACRSKQEVTADDVVETLEAGDVTTHNLAALGGVFVYARNQGWIERTDRMVQSRIPRRHRRITVWKSLLNGS